MRDALGALGPVDGIKPELSNLTLSITTLQKGDIVLVASDGLTDNFDPNVCKFTVNCTLPEPSKTKRPNPSGQNAHREPIGKDGKHGATGHHRTAPKGSGREGQKQDEGKLTVGSQQKTVPPVKPPRKSKASDAESRSSTERSIRSGIIVFFFTTWFMLVKLGSTQLNILISQTY